jgi:hypothetical protein
VTDLLWARFGLLAALAAMVATLSWAVWTNRQ